MSSISGYNAATVSTLNSGEYHHMALSISGTWHTLYLDGVQVAQNLSGGNVFASYTSAVPNLYIGCAGDLSYGFAGSIDDFKIWNRVLPPADISAVYLADIKFSPFYENFRNFVSSSIGSTGGTGTTTRYFSTDGSTRTFTFTTTKAIWTYNCNPTSGGAVDFFYKNSPESPYFFNNQDNYFTDSTTMAVYMQELSDTTLCGISTPLILIAGNYTVSFAVMQTSRTGDYLGNFINIKVSLGNSYIIFNNTGATYTTAGTVSLSAYYYDGTAYTTPSTLMANNPAITNMKIPRVAFVTLTFSNMPSGSNILSFYGTNAGDGFMIAQINVSQL